MPEHHYLSIGEVLGLLLEDFPDVTISKIRFLESQGLIEPERTPSGYRKFYDHDVELLRTILREQRENFLPLKVIRDRIESGALEKEGTGRTPPRGIRNVEVSDPAQAEEPRDSVFRRTDGGPEWVEGRAFVPGHDKPTRGRPSSQPITAAVPIVQSLPLVEQAPEPTAALAEPVVAPAEPAVEPVEPVESMVAADEPPPPQPAEPKTVEPAEPAVDEPPPVVDVAALIEPLPKQPGEALSRESLCGAAGITTDQLAELEGFGIVAGRGRGGDAAYGEDSVEIARIAGRFLAQGIDARHLRAWRQAADREASLFEQRIMPLLRQRNPQSRQAALDTLTQLAELGSALHNAIVRSLLAHHFDGM